MSQQTTPYFQQYANLDTHYYECRTCHGKSWDSDTAALAGKADLSPADVVHDTNCPGAYFTDKHVRRVTLTY